MLKSWWMFYHKNYGYQGLKFYTIHLLISEDVQGYIIFKHPHT